MSPVPMPKSRPLWHRTVGTAVVAGASLGLTWTARQLPTVCPAIYPAPASCAPDARLEPAIWGTIVIVTLFAAFLAASATVSPERKIIVLRWIMAVLGIAAVVVPLWTLGSSGFAL